MDSARGLAALTVIASHMVCAHGLPPCLFPLITNPLRALWHGAAAVQFFFVLSGFVLALPFLKSPASSEIPSIPTFAVRRIFRIYPAFLVALLVGATAKWLASLGPEVLLGSSGWWQSHWAEPTSVTHILKDALLVWRSTGLERILPQDWTLWVELTFSLWVPILAILCRRQPLGFLLIMTVAVAGMGANPIILAFAAGVFIASVRGPWCEWWSRSAVWLRLGVAGLAMTLYTYENTLNPAQLVVVKPLLGDPMLVGAAGLLLVLIGSTRLQRILRWQPFVIVGRLSYGIYLVHAFVIMTALPWIYVLAARCGIHDPTHLWFIGLGAAALISTGLAWPLWKWVEVPGNRFGKRLAAKLTTLLGRAPSAKAGSVIPERGLATGVP